ncbi:MAG: hypothetical protein ABIB04_04485 [Patescibacteria group bacterium]
MKRLFSLGFFSLALLLITPATVLAETTYQFNDLSPSIPHKSGSNFNGIWNDRNNWLVTNGYDTLLVDGKNYSIANLVPAIQTNGMYSIGSVAGVNGTWLILGSTDGSDYFPSWNFTNKNLLLLKYADGKTKKIDISLLKNILNDVYSTELVFSAGSRLYLLIKSYDQNARLFEYINESFSEVTVPDWVIPKLEYIGDFISENGAIKKPIYSGTSVEWLTFDGAWQTETIAEAADYASYIKYSVARGYISRHDSYQNVDYNVLAAYGMKNPRDAVLQANRRIDGSALITGFGANGLRLILALPVNETFVDENKSGTLNLTTARVPLSMSKYVINVHSTGPVKFIRIMKNGLGVAKCYAENCSMTVDVNGTADRFEAWAESAYDLNRPLTSKAVVLRDTSLVTETPSWHAEHNQSTAWSWLQPSSFLHESGETVSWHVGSYLSMPVNYVETKCEILSGRYICRDIALNPTDLERVFKNFKTFTVENYVEGKLANKCTISDQVISTTRTNTLSAKIINPRVDIKDCPVSVSIADSPTVNVTKNYNGYSYQTNVPIGQVRVYSKVSWTENSKKKVTISPTDVIHFKTDSYK